MNYPDALAAAVREFSEQDPLEMARALRVEYEPGDCCFSVAYCSVPFRVFYPGGRVAYAGGTEPPDLEKVLLLQYLSGKGCSQLEQKPVGRREAGWLSFRELPGGELHHVPFQKEAIQPLAARFGNLPADLLTAGKPYGGRGVNMGDCGVVIPALPGVEVAVAVWAGDDEFPPSANIVFGGGAYRYLPTASLWVLGVDISWKLRGEQQEKNRLV